MTHLNYQAPLFIVQDGNERPPKPSGKVKRVYIPLNMRLYLLNEASRNNRTYMNWKPYLVQLERMLTDPSYHFNAESLLQDYTTICGTDFSEAKPQNVRMPLSTAFYVEKLAKELNIAEANLVLYLFALIHHAKEVQHGKHSN